MNPRTSGAAERCARYWLGPAALALCVGCGEPTATGSTSTFSAEISGAVTGRLTGSALASSAAPWSREGVVQVTLPNAGTLSVIVLTAAGGATMISLSRAGADLPVGTYRIARVTTGAPSLPQDAFSAGYTVRRGDALQLFMADSGTVTITRAASRVTGSFTLYANQYDVIPMPSPAQVGTRITPIESGRSPMTITGDFDAAKR